MSTPTPTITWRNWLGLCLLVGPLLGLLVWSGWMVMGWRFLVGLLIGGVWLSLGVWLATWEPHHD